MKKFISIFTIILVMIALFSFSALAAVFVSDAGSDGASGINASAPLKTLAAAYEKISGNGTVVVCGKLTLDGDALILPKSDGKIVITSKYGNIDYASTNDAVLVLKGYTYLSGETEFNNITIHDGSAYYYNQLVCGGNSLTVGDGVTCTVDSGMYMTVLGGTIVSDSNKVEDVSFFDYTVTINSGTWYMVNGSNKRVGSKNPMGATGNVSVIINGGRFTADAKKNADAMISIGGYASQEGDYYLEINGGVFSMPIIAIARPGNNSLRYTAYYEGDVCIRINGGTFNGGSISTVQSELASYIGGNYTLEIGGGTFSEMQINAPRVRGTSACKVLPSLSDFVSGFDVVGDIGVNDRKDKTPDLAASYGVAFVGGDTDGDGSNAKTPYVRVEDAVAKLGESGGTIVVCKPLKIKDIELPKSGNITFTSVYGGYDFRSLNDAKIKLYGYFSLGGETVFDGISIESRSNGAAIFCNNNKTVFGSDIVSTSHIDGGINNYVTIYGGARVLANSPSVLGTSQVDLTICGGKWHSVYLGNRRIHGGSYTLRTIKGDSTLNISGGEFNGEVCLTGMNNHTGAVTANISGGKFLCSIFGMAVPVTVDNDISSVNGDITVNLSGGEFHGDVSPVQNKEKNIFNGCYTLKIDGADLRCVGEISGISGISGVCTSKLITTVDLSRESVGNVTYTNPIIESGADPSVFYSDGWYYYVSTAFTSDKPAIKISRSANITDIGNTVATTVFTVTDEYNIASIWAPQIYLFDGKWYVYFSGADTDSASVKRTPYVLESDTSDPFGTYTMVGTMQNMDDSIYSWLSPRVFEYNDERYYISSVFETAEDNSASKHLQKLIVGKLSSPTAFAGGVNVIAAPDKSWEAYDIMEGPFPIYGEDGILYIAYAANYANSNEYCTGLLKLVGDDVTSAACWQKLEHPMQMRDDSNLVFAPGATVFAPSPDGSGIYAMYHAKLHADNEYNRSMFVQKLEYKDGVPFLGAPPMIETVHSIKVNPMSVAKRVKGFETLSVTHSSDDEGVSLFLNPVDGATAYIIRRDGVLLSSGNAISVLDSEASPGPHLYKIQAVALGKVIAAEEIRQVAYNNLRYKDLNGDEKIDVRDVMLLLKAILDNINTEATMQDVLQMLKCAV